jgi:hypothetical protein
VRSTCAYTRRPVLKPLGCREPSVALDDAIDGLVECDQEGHIVADNPANILVPVLTQRWSCL